MILLSIRDQVTMAETTTAADGLCVNLVSDLTETRMFCFIHFIYCVR